MSTTEVEIDGIQRVGEVSATRYQILPVAFDGPIIVSCAISPIPDQLNCEYQTLARENVRFWPIAGLGGRPFSTQIAPERRPNPDPALCAFGKPARCALSRISFVEGEKRRRWLYLTRNPGIPALRHKSDMEHVQQVSAFVACELANGTLYYEGRFPIHAEKRSR